ncbi:GH32 C-terminal domain-containing protein [Microlunatus ginsengisoli]|uniref:beta-fructofuranosidase n=1 Tax=Microlunatus ginsengisoli TaxID=363863 RepID=A0ABP6ZTH3_9ACTN
MTVHFRPPGGYVGDLIPFERDGRLWLFYLLDERRDPPTGMPWALASTEDFVSYTDHGVVLPSGGPDAADFDCYTGCVIDDGEQLHLFYTGHNPARRTAAGDLQVVCHATSDGDLTQWQRHPDHTFGAPAGYWPEDWRDPYVYRVTADEPWLMVLAARHIGQPERRGGVVARLTSTDLVTWQPTTPLWDPHRFITQECPEVFQWGDWWYLVYSEFSDAFQTRYRIAPGPEGPWSAPVRDSIDGRARYASKSVARDGRRFFVGWIATRQGDHDDGDWEWAGDLAVLEASQQADGTLGFGLPRELVDSFTDASNLRLEPIDGSAGTPGFGPSDGYAAWLGPMLADPCIVTLTLELTAGSGAFGLLLRTDDTAETGYELRLEPARNRIVFDRWPRGRTGPAQWQARGDVPHAVELERPCPLPAGAHTVQVLIDGSTCVAVVDDQVALTTRLYDHASGRIGLFTCDGPIDVTEMLVARRS